MQKFLLVLAGAALASQAQAQTVTNYWDFESMTDVVGGVATTAVGTPDMSLHATYGEAYPGANQSLNTVLGGTGAGGGFLEGDVHDGTNPTDLIFGTADFSLSYWAFDDTTDGDGRGPRVFDCLDGTTIGIQLGTNTTNDYNFRVDDDQGGSTITNNTLLIQMPGDAWVHVAVNVDRANSLIEIFFDGVSQGTVVLNSTTAASVFPTQDLQLGVINGGQTAVTAQNSGLDDLAFYDGLLSAAGITGLANGTLTPLNFTGGPGAQYCPGDGIAPHTTCPCVNNNNGSMGGCDWADPAFPEGGVLSATGSSSMAANDTLLVATGIANNFGIFFGANNAVNGGNGNPLNDGLRCAGGGLVRLIAPTMASGNQMTLPAPLQLLDVNAASGATRRYQYWFRTPNGPCGQQANLTNGYEIVWLP